CADCQDAGNAGGGGSVHDTNDIRGELLVVEMRVGVEEIHVANYRIGRTLNPHPNPLPKGEGMVAPPSSVPWFSLERLAVLAGSRDGLWLRPRPRERRLGRKGPC